MDRELKNEIKNIKNYNLTWPSMNMNKIHNLVIIYQNVSEMVVCLLINNFWQYIKNLSLVSFLMNSFSLLGTTPISHDVMGKKIATFKKWIRSHMKCQPTQIIIIFGLFIEKRELNYVQNLQGQRQRSARCFRHFEQPRELSQ